LHVPNSSRIAHGETVSAGEVMARSKGMFGLMKTDVKAAATGTIESVSDSSGMVFLRGAPQPIEIIVPLDDVPSAKSRVIHHDGGIRGKPFKSPTGRSQASVKMVFMTKSRYLRSRVR